MAFRTGSTAAETVLHELVLDLVPLCVHPLEELVDSDNAIFIPFYAVAVPDNIFFFFREIAIGLERADAVARSDMYKMLGEPAHLVTAPACYGSVINTAGLIGYYKIFADAYDFA